MSETVIRVSNVSKTYQLGPLSSLWSLPSRLWSGRTDGLERKDVFWALRDVSFEVKRGETLGIVGANGAGKSTLLKILCRVTEQTQGEVSIVGSVAPLIELGAGFHPELTGRENVFLNAAIMGMSRKTAESRFDEIVEFAELRSFIDTPVKKYSSGMLVRLGFSVAVQMEPEILLVDEVLSVGDQRFKLRCMEKVNELKRKNTTIVLVSHDLNLVKMTCTNALLLDQGKIAAKGDVFDVLQQYGYSMNVTDGKKGRLAETRGAGSAIVAICGIEFLEANGIKKNAFDILKDIRIDVHIEAKATVTETEVRAGVSTIENQNEYACLMSSFQATGSPMQLREGFNLVSFILQGGQLYPRFYSIHVSVGTMDGVILDYVVANENLKIVASEENHPNQNRPYQRCIFAPRFTFAVMDRGAQGCP